jgi:hypothetical protein
VFLKHPVMAWNILFPVGNPARLILGYLLLSGFLVACEGSSQLEPTTTASSVRSTSSSVQSTTTQTSAAQSTTAVDPAASGELPTSTGVLEPGEYDATTFEPSFRLFVGEGLSLQVHAPSLVILGRLNSAGFSEAFLVVAADDRPVDVVADELLSETAMGDPATQTATLWGLEALEINGQATSEFAFAFFGDAGSARGWYAEAGDKYRVYLVDRDGQTIAVKYWGHEPEFDDFQTEIEELVRHVEFS